MYNEKNYADIRNSKVIGAKSKDQASIMNSASGGIFYTLAEYYIENNGVVFGAAFDEKMRVVHIKGTTIDDLTLMQNSKYVQSDLNDTFHEIEQLLKNENREVLFCGTPCQCAGLKCFLGKDYDNLLCVDFICHGVPSPELFEKYLSWACNKYNFPEVKDYKFRCKHKGWCYHGYMSSFTKVNELIIPTLKDPYMLNFLSGNTYRESCYKCNFNVEFKYSDLTLGDFGGIKQTNPDFFSSGGCSVVFINSEKGKKSLDLICDKLEVVDTDFESVSKYNQILLGPAKRKSNRDTIYEGLQSSCGVRYTNEKLLPRVSRKSLVLFFMPEKVKNLVKKFASRIKTAR